MSLPSRRRVSSSYPSSSLHHNPPTATHLQADPALVTRPIPQSWLDRFRLHQSLIMIVTVLVMVVGVTVVQTNFQALELRMGLPGGRFSAAGAAQTLDPAQIVEGDAEQGLIVRLNRPVTSLIRNNREERVAQPERIREVNALGMYRYTVVAGDSVWSIASRNNLQPTSIQWANPHLETSSHLNIGDILFIPPVDGAVHRIVPGDTLFELANRYEAVVPDIVGYEFNNLASQNTPLIVGQDLFMPGGIQPAPPPASIQYAVDVPLGDFKGTGQFRPAVAGTYITQGFWSGHRAIDYAGRIGTPIVASDQGVVAHAHYGWNHGYGNLVVIDHGNGFSSLYAHLASITVKNGDRVRQGQQIGTLGNTGRSTGPHLHLEIRLNGVQQHPLGYIRE